MVLWQKMLNVERLLKREFWWNLLVDIKQILQMNSIMNRIQN